MKLLRVLQERRFQRLGDTKDLPFSSKIIAATNRDLAAEMRAGSRFCPHCGAVNRSYMDIKDEHDPDAPIICVGCSTRVPDGFKFCKQCGLKVHRDSKRLRGVGSMLGKGAAAARRMSRDP